MLAESLFDMIEYYFIIFFNQVWTLEIIKNIKKKKKH